MGQVVGTLIELSRAHQEVAYALTFVLAMAEALPAIGIVVPGTAAIIGISALVPTGAIGFWPMVISATVGAIVGDGVSYWLGYHFHSAITGHWPLNRYPLLIARGEAFFHRHGGKSVFIARFTPGVRAIVPLTAGTLRMSRLRFYAMNFLSAILWALSHILVGVALGASLELLGAVAGRLAVLLVLVTTVLVAAGLMVRYAIRRLPALLARGLTALMAWAQTNDTWPSRQILSLLDPTRKELPGLIVLGALLVGSLWLFFGVLQDVIGGDPLMRADVAVFHFLQALRTGWVDRLMVTVTEVGDGSVMMSLTLATLLWLAWQRAWRTILYEVAAVAGAGLFTLFFKLTLHLSRPNGTFRGWDAFSFPSGHTAVSASLFGFLTILVAWETPPRWRLAVATAATLLVSSIGFSRLYLGAHWLSDVLAGIAFGIAWSALLGIAYFRRDPPSIRPGGLGAAAAVALLVVSGIHISRHHAADMDRYAVQERVRTMSLAAWWRQGWMELPVWRVDLTGEYEEPLTVQWAGSLQALELELASKGWTAPVPWTARSTLAWLAPNVAIRDLPVLPRLENGHEERLVMTRPMPNEPAAVRLVFRVWKSDIALSETNAPIAPVFVGTVAEQHVERVGWGLTVTRDLSNFNGPRDILAAAMSSSRLAYRGSVAHEANWDGAVLLARSPKLKLPGHEGPPNVWPMRR